MKEAQNCNPFFSKKTRKLFSKRKTAEINFCGCSETLGELEKTIKNSKHIYYRRQSWNKHCSKSHEQKALIVTDCTLWEEHSINALKVLSANSFSLPCIYYWLFKAPKGINNLRMLQTELRLRSVSSSWLDGREFNSYCFLSQHTAWLHETN